MLQWILGFFFLNYQHTRKDGEGQINEKKKEDRKMSKVPVSGEKKGSAIKTFLSEKTQQDTVTKCICHSTEG